MLHICTFLARASFQEKQRLGGAPCHVFAVCTHIK